MASLVREAWEGLLDLLYPPKCLVCREFGPNVLCDSCRSDFRPLTPPLCDRCGEPIDTTPSGLCSRCQKSSAYYSQARGAGHFDGALRKAILALKYGGRRRLAEPLGQFLADYLKTDPFDGDHDMIVPIPLHPSRERERGFNQSSLIAEVVGRELGSPVVKALVRKRRTRPQVELPASEREGNVRDAFSAPDPSLVREKRVLLLDDVLTTLHTADECARMLDAAGAARVDVAGVARG